MTNRSQSRMRLDAIKSSRGFYTNCVHQFGLLPARKHRRRHSSSSWHSSLRSMFLFLNCLGSTQIVLSQSGYHARCFAACGSRSSVGTGSHHQPVILRRIMPLCKRGRHSLGPPIDPTGGPTTLLAFPSVRARTTPTVTQCTCAAVIHDGTANLTPVLHQCYMAL